MTRPARMLIILGIFGVGAVVVLSMIAHRYDKMMRRAQPEAPARSSAAEPATPPVGGAGSNPPAELGSAGSIEAQARALRYVDAFIEVQRRLAAAGESDPDSASAAPSAARAEEEARLLDRALADAGLDRATYDGLLDLYAKWKAGRTDLTGPLPAAFAQRGEELRALE